MASGITVFITTAQGVVKNSPREAQEKILVFAGRIANPYFTDMGVRANTASNELNIRFTTYSVFEDGDELTIVLPAGLTVNSGGFTIISQLEPEEGGCLHIVGLEEEQGSVVISLRRFGGKPSPRGTIYLVSKTLNATHTNPRRLRDACRAFIRPMHC